MSEKASVAVLADALLSEIFTHLVLESHDLGCFLGRTLNGLYLRLFFGWRNPLAFLRVGFARVEIG